MGKHIHGQLKSVALAIMVIGASAVALCFEASTHVRRMAEREAHKGAALLPQPSIPEMLQEINAQQNPQINGYLNGERAQFLRNKLVTEPMNPNDTVRTELLYGRELLNAGKTADSLKEFQFLKRQFKTGAPQAWKDAGPVILMEESIAYLRMGEAQNCCSRNNSRSCLLPISGAGVHTKQEGSRGAIKCLSEALDLQPENVSARWLLNIAYMTIGEYPNSVPKQWLIPLNKYGGDYPMKKFYNAAPELGLDLLGWAGSVTMDDFEGKGLLGFVVSSYNRNGQLRYIHNNGDGSFTDVSKQAHLDKVILGMGLNYGDLDNDGWLDFYSGTGNPDLGMLVPNRMFRNHDGRFFDEVTTTGDFGHLQKGHGIAFGDVNNNGQQDVFLIAGGAFEGDTAHDCLFVNPGTKNHWVTLSLEGVKSNRIALGAEICVDISTLQGDRRIYKTVSTGASFGNNPLRQEIGLGNAAAIKQITIHWPSSGIDQTINNLAMDRFYRIREGESRAQPWNVPTFALKYGH